MEKLRTAMKQMNLVNVTPGVLPAKQKDAEALQEDLPVGQEDVLAAEWFSGHPLQSGGAAEAAGSSLPPPVAPWKQDLQAPSMAGALPSVAAAAPGQSLAATAAAAAAADDAVNAGALPAAVGAAGIEAASAASEDMAAAAAQDMGAAAAAGWTGGSSFVQAADAAALKVGGHSRFGGHHRATLDVAAATGTGTALLGKRTHASRRGATYAELVRPVHGQLVWDVFRRLLRACTTAKGISFQRLGDMWDVEMEDNPALTPKSVVVLKAAERSYADYLALKRSVCAMQEGGDAAPTEPGGSAAAAAAGSSAAAVLGGATTVVGAGFLPFLQVPQGVGQLVRTAQGQVVMLPHALAAQQLQHTMAAAAVPRPMGLPQGGALGVINPQVLAAAAAFAGSAGHQALLLQQQQQQAFVQQQLLLQQALMQQQRQRLLVQQQQSVAQGQQQQQTGQQQEQQQPGSRLE